MRLAWAVVAGLALGIGAAWWLSSREPPQADRARAERAAAEDARPVLYRWRDTAGVLHVADKPPRGRGYERIDRTAKEGIEVNGDRQ